MRKNRQSNRWGVVLAGGDGVRLRRLTQHIAGDDRPKQFCRIYGDATLIEQARRRAERSIRPDRVLYSLNRLHEPFYAPLLGDCAGQWVLQPQNKGTAPGILSALATIARQNPNATVAVLPSDHYYSDEGAVTRALERAFEMAEWEPDSIVMIGARPTHAETEYGWIETGAPVDLKADSFRVNAFHEKPSEEMAEVYWQRGMLWSTFTMVANAMAYLEAMFTAMPALYKLFHRCPVERGARGEMLMDDSLYANIETGDFSRQVLAAETGRLTVHRLGPVVWSDLGDSGRALEALAHAGEEPHWAESWRARQEGQGGLRWVAAQ
jgi:mannose-1-phosphate guanylyltransferase